jgi:hypothetical protein
MIAGLRESPGKAQAAIPDWAIWARRARVSIPEPLGPVSDSVSHLLLSTLSATRQEPLDASSAAVPSGTQLFVGGLKATLEVPRAGRRATATNTYHGD